MNNSLVLLPILIPLTGAPVALLLAQPVIARKRLGRWA